MGSEILSGPARVAVGALLLLTACGDDDAMGVPNVDAMPRDASREAASDAGVDGSGDDASDVDASDVDGDVIDDGGVDGTTGGDAAVPTCSLNGSVRPLATTGVDMTDPPTLALGESGLVVGWTAFEGADPRVTFLYLPYDMSAPGSSAPSDYMSTQHGPYAVATSDGFVIAWRDDEGGDYEILARSIDANGVVGEAHAITDDDADDESPSLVVTESDEVLAVWTSADGGHARRIGFDAAPLAPANPLAGMDDVVGRPALSTVGGSMRIASAWLDDTGRVRMQMLSPSGLAATSAGDVSSDDSAVGSVSLAPAASGVALAFDARVGGDRPEIRFRRLGDDGIAFGVEHTLTTRPATGTAGAITELASGFALAYRGATSADEAVGLRLGLVAAEGEALGSIELAAVSPPSTSTIVRRAPDGHTLHVAWTDDSGMFLASVSCE